MEASIDSAAAVAALGALAQENRLALFRLLVKAGDEGMRPGALAETLGIPASSLSFHLGQLSRAGLLRQKKQHRSIIYSVNHIATKALITYLLDNCCSGTVCGRLAASSTTTPSAEPPKSA